MPETVEILLVEDKHEILREKFPGMNCFRIQRGNETVGRCVGCVHADKEGLQGWLRPQMEIRHKLDEQQFSFPIGVLEEIRIFELFQGNRYSAIATDRFLEWCETNNCLQVILNAVPQANCTVNLVHLYEKSGFKVLDKSSLGGDFMLWAKPGVNVKI